MSNYADRLNNAIKKKGNPCIVGLDPRLDEMPALVKTSHSSAAELDSAIRETIYNYHKLVIDTIYKLVPGVKLQIAFYEQYGIGGMLAFKDTIEYAKKHELIVIVDAKRNDISSTAEAYANALLGRTKIFGEYKSITDADCITVSPYLGRESIAPFVETCKKYGKGIFILVKTSNPGSGDFQDLKLADGNELYKKVAEMVNECSKGLVGETGYSSIGAVVGATFPEEAKKLRKLMPNSIFLVPGYGAQGGAAKDIKAFFNEDGLGAIVSSSRGLTYDLGPLSMGKEQVTAEIKKRTKAMIYDISNAINNLK